MKRDRRLTLADRLASGAEGGRRRYFGTDGVRGVVGETLTGDLVERLGRAATSWAGRGRVLVGRDTRASGPSSRPRSREASCPPAASPCSEGCCRPRRSRCSRRISASSCPPPTTLPSTTASRSSTVTGTSCPTRTSSRSRRCWTFPAAVAAQSSTPTTPSEGYVEHILEHFGTDLTGLRIAVDCANGAFSHIAPAVFEQLGADVTAIATDPDGSNINVGCGATDLSLLRIGRRGGLVRPRGGVRRRRRPHACRRRDRSARRRRPGRWPSQPCTPASSSSPSPR